MSAPDGSGKSRLLIEIARVARSRDVIVLTAEGGSRGTWGGVGSLTRQLVQLLGRGARKCVQHEEALQHLLNEHDAEPARESRAREFTGVEGRDPLVSSCTAAVTDLVRMAFRDTPGLLLLDDEENLPPAARQVWRSTGQFVQAVNENGGVLNALLVSTSTKSYPAELGADRVAVELRPWRQRDLEKFLARAFASPGGARDASVAIHRVAGGRPGDVVGYLRELERRGLLRREGLRCCLDAPLATLPPLSGGMGEQVRRALESCGRDASSLVECLAVAADVRLSRTAIGDICDVRGPRLAAAADLAVAAGLLVVDGASWRVRTDAVAHKVYAALPADRRRVLHREVLNVLLDTAPDAIDPIAHHARASADPRADAWTREAIDRAKAAGNWTAALRHVEHAILTSAHSVDKLERAFLLLSTGRLGETIQDLTLMSGTGDAVLDHQRTVLLAKALYEARDWSSVLDVALGDTHTCPHQLAQLRYLRATAFRHLGEHGMADREARLAAAESLAIDNSTQTLRLEYLYQTHLYKRDWEQARHALVAKIRLARSLSDARQLIVDLTKLGNAARYLAHDTSLSQGILIRARALSRASGEVGGAVRSALFGALAYCAAARHLAKRARTHFDKSCFYAVQSGAQSLILAARIRFAAAALIAGSSSYEQRRLVGALATDPEARRQVGVMSACVDLGLCFLYYSYQVELEDMARDYHARLSGDRRTVVLDGFAIVGQLLLLEQPDKGSARSLLKRLIRSGVSDLWLAALSAMPLHAAYADDARLHVLMQRDVVVRLCERSSYPAWGNAALALSLALWIPIPYDDQVWDRLLSVVRRHRGPLPIALEWQRVLMESREARRRGNWNEAQKLDQSAREQLRLLTHAPGSHRGSAAVMRWSAKLERPRTSHHENEQRLGVINGDDCIDSHLPAAWRAALLAAGGAGRMVVVCAHRREASTFAQAASKLRDGAHLASSAVELAGIGRERHVILDGVDAWPPADLERAIAHFGSGGMGCTTTMSVPLHDFRERGSLEKRLCELIDGTLVLAGPLLAEPALIEAWFRRCVARFGRTVVFDRVALDQLATYRWPGGLAELEAVASACATRAEVVNAELLHDIGFQARRSATMAQLESGELELVQLVSSSGPASISMISRATGRSARTLLRWLRRLVDRGLLAREGRGRATRYLVRRESPLR